MLLLRHRLGQLQWGKNTGFQGESLTLLAVGKVSKLGLEEGLLILVPVAFYDLSFFTV